MRAARILAGLLLAAVLLVPAAAAAPVRSERALTPLESGVLADINAFRRSHRLAPLRLNARLTAAARAHTVQMAHDGYFSHDSADGSSFWKRIQAFYASSPWTYWSVGENLLWSSPNVSPKRALAMWLASPEHKKNLMNPAWREIGVAAVHEAAAPGVFKGLDVTIVTTDFGVRR
ncbi:MAG TPA: CAP domain-containing protein [Gaiellaceae bacterium]|nr:CAP domain-containing protein [Gaiellaceae bacterium]